MDLAKLKKLEALASPAPWEADDFRCEDGDGEYRAFHVLDPKGKALLDTSNSEIQLISDDRGEGPDGPEGSRWDENGQNDTFFIAEMRNVAPKLISTIETLQAALHKAVGMLEHASVSLDWTEEEAAQAQDIWDADVAVIRAALEGK